MTENKAVAEIRDPKLRQLLNSFLDWSRRDYELSMQRINHIRESGMARISQGRAGQ